MNDTIQKIADDLKALAIHTADHGISGWNGHDKINAIASRLRALSARASAGEGVECKCSTPDKYICARNEGNEGYACACECHVWKPALITTPQPAQAGASGGGDIDQLIARVDKVADDLLDPNDCSSSWELADELYNVCADLRSTLTPASPATGEEGLEQIGGLEFYLHEDPDAEDEIEPVRLVMAMSVGNKVYCHRITQGNNGICCDATPPAHGDGEGDARAEFERWVAKRWGYSTERWADSGEYLYQNTRDWWQCWQAALTTRPTPEAQEARDAARLDWLAHHGASIRQDQPFNGSGWFVLAPCHTGIPSVDGRVRYKTFREAIDAALALPAQGEGNNG